MENKNNVINWFPGHMQKSMRLFSEEIKNIDFFIEVIDARAIKQSSNYELNQLFNNKIKITVAVKSDLVDVKKYSKLYPDIIFISIHNKSYRSKIINEIKNKCSQKINSLIKKGYVNYQLFGMVIGLPNVGKSSLINFILNKKHLVVQNKPGVTRKKQWTKVTDNIMLLDTPGVFFKKVENFDVGCILTMIKTVNFEVVDQYEVLKNFYFYINNKYDNLLNKHFDILENVDDFDFFINKLCEKKKFFNEKNIYDMHRCFLYLYNFLDDNKDMGIDFN